VSYNPSDFSTEGDFALVNRLLQNPRYAIPEHLRHKMIKCAESVIDANDTKHETKLKAIQTLSTMDKHNIDIVKLAMPKKVEHSDVKSISDEELLKLVQDIAKRMPTVLTVG
jgi:hypothetical protein